MPEERLHKYTVILDSNAGEAQAAIYIETDASIHQVAREHSLWYDKLVEAVAEDYDLSLMDDSEVEDAEISAESYYVVAVVEGHPRFSLGY